MKRLLVLAISVTLAVASATHASPSIEQLLAQYAQTGAGPFSAAAGERLWMTRFAAADGQRQCATCHGADPRQTGRHARTGKTIAPLAPSVNSARLTDMGEVNKWLKRNCKWTLGRECSAQEKGDLLSYLSRL